MNNKKKGSDFEKLFADVLAKRGFWVHFMHPAPDGGQPFDVIAVKNGEAYAFDCKTCDSDVFTYDRLEQNQRLAFEKWMRCGNSQPQIAVYHNGYIYMIGYQKLKARERVELVKEEVWL